MMIELNAVSCCRPGRGFFVFHKNLFSTLCSDSVLLKLLFLSGTYLHLWALFFMLFIIVFSAILSANLKKNYILPVAINTNIFHILLLNSCKDLKRLSMYSLGFLSFLFFFYIYATNVFHCSWKKKYFLWCLINHSWNQYCLFTEIPYYWPPLPLGYSHESIWKLTGLDDPDEYFRVYTDEGLICKGQVRSSGIKLPQHP